MMDCALFSNFPLFDHNTRFFHLLSTILLAVTAIFHSQVPTESQHEGAQQCIFHLTVTLCVIHFQIFFFVHDKVSSFSLSFDYMFIILGLASFLWSSMLAHQLWKDFGKNETSEETLGTVSRLLLGYGIPSLFLISALGPASSHKIRKQMFCQIIVPLALLFAVLVQIVNTFFFVDLLRKALCRILWYSCDKSLKLKEIIYRNNLFGFNEWILLSIVKMKIILQTVFRTFAFTMLFYILALPWLCIMGFKLHSLLTKSEEPIKIFSLVLHFFSAEGIFLSIVIMYHKYAWKNSSIKKEKSREKSREKIAYEYVTLWERSVE